MKNPKDLVLRGLVFCVHVVSRVRVGIDKHLVHNAIVEIVVLHGLGTVDVGLELELVPEIILRLGIVALCK